MNECDPDRAIGFGSVAPCVIAPRARARRGEAKLREIHALLGPIDAPNGRPPRCRARPPVVSTGCLAIFVLPAPAARPRQSNFDWGGCPGGVR